MTTIPSHCKYCDSEWIRDARWSKPDSEHEDVERTYQCRSIYELKDGVECWIRSKICIQQVEAKELPGFIRFGSEYAGKWNFIVGPAPSETISYRPIYDQIPGQEP